MKARVVIERAKMSEGKPEGLLLKSQLEEILKPLREVKETYKMERIMSKFDEAMRGENDTDEYCENGPMIEYVYSMIRAIDETLEIADKP